MGRARRTRGPPVSDPGRPEAGAALAGTVVRAADGAQALRLARPGGQAGIATDMHMPVREGIGAATLIRDLPVGVGVPIIGVNADAFAAAPQRRPPVGTNEVIVNPCEPEVLDAALDRGLAGGAGATGQGRPHPPAGGRFIPDGGTTAATARPPAARAPWRPRRAAR